MSAKIIMPLEFHSVKGQNQAALNQFSRYAPSAKIIERRNVEYWMRKITHPVASVNTHGSSEVKSVIHQICDRVERMKCAFYFGNESEVITHSARISVLANQIGLPKTSILAREIGEALMSDDKRKTRQLLRKLENIISDLCQDMQSQKN